MCSSLFNIKNRLKVTKDFNNVFDYYLLSEDNYNDDDTYCLIPLYNEDIKECIYASIRYNPNNLVNKFNLDFFYEHKNSFKYYQLQNTPFLNGIISTFHPIEKDYGDNLLSTFIDSKIKNNKILLNGHYEKDLHIISIINKRVQYIKDDEIELDAINNSYIGINKSNDINEYDIYSHDYRTLIKPVYIDNVKNIYNYSFSIQIGDNRYSIYDNKDTVAITENDKILTLKDKKYSLLAQSDYIMDIKSEVYGFVKIRNVEEVSSKLNKCLLFNDYYLLKHNIINNCFTINEDCIEIVQDLLNRFSFEDILTPSDFSKLTGIEFYSNEIPF